MRIRIFLDLENKTIPVKYPSIVQGIIYHMLENYKDIEFLHDEGYKLENRKFKLFTFSEIFGECSFISDRKELLFKNNGYFDITSFNDSLIVEICNFLDNNRSLLFHNNIIKVIGYSLLDEKINSLETESYSTISPITCYVTKENKKIEYLDPNTDDYKNYLINNLRKKYFLCYKKDMKDIEILSITNVKEKKVYIQKNFVIANHLTITFNHLNESIKKVILCCGLGSKSSTGFGMVNIFSNI